MALVVAAVTLTSWSGTSPDSGPQSVGAAAAAPTVVRLASSGSAGPAAARNGTFKGDNEKHVTGTATVSGGKVVLSGFSSDTGPDLHIYLANGATENDVSAGKQLGTIAYDKASQTFALNGVDPSKYRAVVIHRDKAKAVCEDAPLS